METLKYLAIRDDDLCFFTQPSEIKAIYAPIFGRVPVSFACVSHTVANHCNQIFFSDRAAHGYHSLGNNRPLVNYVRQLLKRGFCDVMVHGYSHEFREVGGKWQPECIWKPAEQLAKEIADARDYLGDLFGVQPKVFVPPSNTIGTAGVKAVAEARLDLSALLTLRPNHSWSSRYAACYCKRWGYRLARGRQYPFTLDFGTHRELVAYALCRPAEYPKLLRKLYACSELRAPFVITTHYWQMADDPYLRVALLNLVDKALELGYAPATVAEAIAGRRYPPVISDKAHAHTAH